MNHTGTPRAALAALLLLLGSAGALLLHHHNEAGTRAGSKPSKVAPSHDERFLCRAWMKLSPWMCM